MTYTLVLNDNQINQLISKYKDYETIDNNNYTLFRGKIKSTTLTIFKTKKIMIQGNNSLSLYKEIIDLFNLNINISYEDKVVNCSIGQDIIGSDEVGTGDFFGGIVVCCSLVPHQKILELTKMGIKDSKEINDEKILELGAYLINNINHSVLLLNNDLYNKIIKSNNMNMNSIKAVLHNKVINNFINKYKDIKYDDIVIDAFTTKDKFYNYLKGKPNIINNINLVEKAENKYISVACSSIIARYYFLKHINDLSKKTGYNILKGSSKKVDELARKIVNEKGIAFLKQIVKTNFNNMNKL